MKRGYYKEQLYRLETRKRCQGIRNAKRVPQPCQMTAVEGERFCHFHRGRA